MALISGGVDYTYIADAPDASIAARKSPVQSTHADFYFMRARRAPIRLAISAHRPCPQHDADALPPFPSPPLSLSRTPPLRLYAMTRFLGFRR